MATVFQPVETSDLHNTNSVPYSQTSYVRQVLGRCAWKRGDWIVVIKAFFDESWNPNRPRMFAVAGVLARADEWDSIEAGWKAALDETNAELTRQGRRLISRYHASEMNAHDREYEGWINEENAAFDQRMLSVIRGRDIFIFSFAIVLDDMVKVFPSWAEDINGNAYGFAFRRCLLTSGRIAANPDFFKPGQKIKVWHDQCAWPYFALTAFQKTQTDSTYSENWRFNELSHSSSKDNVCLQVADMMVYDCWRESERVRYDSKRNMGKFFSELVNVEKHRVYATYADERYFREVRELHEADKGKSND